MNKEQEQIVKNNYLLSFVMIIEFLIIILILLFK